MKIDQKQLDPVCPNHGFRVFSRRYPKCERCSASLPEAIVYSAGELAVLREEEQKQDLEREWQRWRDVPVSVGVDGSVVYPAADVPFLSDGGGTDGS